MSSEKAKTISTLTSLIKEGYIRATNVTLQTSPQDRLLRFEEEATTAVRRAPGTKKGPLSAKDIIQVKETARRKLELETDEIENSGFVSTV